MKALAFGFNLNSLAFGFKVDLSELRDPIEELGDKPGALAAEFAATRSDVDDVELPCI